MGPPTTVRMAFLAAYVSWLSLVGSVNSLNATGPPCTLPTYNWTENSLHQDACTMAAYAFSACSNADVHLAAITPTLSTYGGPTDDSDPCECNTVFYSLISACAGCQGGTWDQYSVYTQNCTSDFPKGQFAPGVVIPVDTAFPAWAYDPIATNMFSNTTAFETFLSNKTEFKHPVASDTTSTTSPSAETSSSTGTSSSAGISTSISSPASTSTTSSSKSHAGAIAGGVVGGIVGLALIIGSVAFFFIRRRRGASVVNATTSETQQLHDTYTEVPLTATQPYSPKRYYDPSDPSTFPDVMFNDRNGSSVALSSHAPGAPSMISGQHTMGTSGMSSTAHGSFHPGLPEV
ncbi:hypothetical protein PENSPDRAFT_296670 [Peniophora sp. CONT]|nr:hypothetical protein PENSPDRAFT_296670 [Peniophora sp. CONT]